MRLAAESFAYTRRFDARGRITLEHRGAAEDLVACLTSPATIGDSDTDDDSAAPEAPGERWAGQDDHTRASVTDQLRRGTT
ncbi:hypothetical protein SE17_06885 [Kouleothrix aurantiaca]|uniref:Uncharacterized protein n=1 Tax=Kouleothrix aurantiaca TaxID=186479 RepID=A0A0P9FL17_9CHLR|nr:hypothetical protein SE17_06885 [Kouleothrix aurantiaca]